MLTFIKKHKFDFILVSAILIILISTLIYFAATKTEGAYAVVIINDNQVAEYPLNKDTTVTLTNGDQHNILIIENGAARISEASCPDKLCVSQQKAKYNGEMLVCLPNKTIVKIVSDINSETDFIS